MVESLRGVSFPVVFSDGETEADIGNVVVFPTLDFKQFLSVLSNKIGISPHQFTVFLSSPETRHRIPITGKVNFCAIERNCFFLVELKRSRRERRRKNQGFQQYDHQEFQENDYHNTASFGAQNPINKNFNLENFMLLRRGMEIERVAELGMPFSGRVEYENNVRKMQIERERFLSNMGLERPDGFGLGPGYRGRSTECEEEVLCEACARAKAMGRDVDFHWCAYDAVTVGFRSPAGPISRPTRRSE